MSTTRYLITGGAGFIGSHIAETLLKRGEVVGIFDNFVTGKQDNLAHLRGHLELMHGDLRDVQAVKSAMKGVEVVFHQGALASVPRSIKDPVSSLEVNINGTQNILLAARDSGVRRVVYASSSSVYGNTPLYLSTKKCVPIQCLLMPYKSLLASFYVAFLRVFMDLKQLHYVTSTSLGLDRTQHQSTLL